MDEWMTYLVPVLALTLLCAGWLAVQLLAKRMEIKNHIDQTSGCCGACSNRDRCDKVEHED